MAGLYDYESELSNFNHEEKEQMVWVLFSIASNTKSNWKQKSAKRYKKALYLLIILVSYKTKKTCIIYDFYIVLKY